MQACAFVAGRAAASRDGVPGDPGKRPAQGARELQGSPLLRSPRFHDLQFAGTPVEDWRCRPLPSSCGSLLLRDEFEERTKP